MQTKIYCLPFAGGNASIYAGLQEHLPLSVTAIPLELPGHGIRCREPLMVRMQDLVEDLFNGIERQLEGTYYLLGCSMGALVSYELARRILVSGRPAPAGLIVAAQKAPSIGSSLPHLCDQPAEELKAFLRRMGGLSDILLQNESLLGCFLPLIRADMSLVEKYGYQGAAPLVTPILAFYSQTDTLYSRSAVEAWRHFSALHFELHEVPGGHFFVRSHPREFLARLLPRIAHHQSLLEKACALTQEDL